MLTPDIHTLKAIQRLSSNEDFVKMMGWITSMKDGFATAMESVEDPTQLRWVQGKLQVLTSITMVISKASLLIQADERPDESKRNPNI